MSFFTNKHVVVAMLVAPVLAIISYFAVDSVVSEKPHKAEDGRAYALVEKPNCRYSSGKCGLKNGNFEVEIKASAVTEHKIVLELTSNHPLSRVLLGVGKGETVNGDPAVMRPQGEGQTVWSIELPKLRSEDRLQLAIAADNTYYYGDSGVRFIDYETTFSKDFRQPANP